LCITLVAIHLIYSAQARFVERRQKWLRAMSKTILVKGLPQEISADPVSPDAAIKGFFQSVFPDATVEHAFVVTNTRSGIVTFGSQRDAQVVMNSKLSYDTSEFVMSVPPEPSDVLYKSLDDSSLRSNLSMVTGYAALLSLFFLFIPVVAAISAATSLESIDQYHLVATTLKNYPTVRSLVEGIASCLALTLWLSLLPTFINAITTTFFPLNSQAWSQLYLQHWYHAFLVIFVLLATAVGRSLLLRLEEILESPSRIFALLASGLPHSSEWYINYIAVQWYDHALHFIRYVPLSKYLVYRRLYGSEKAHTLSEPENQDYYGIGARTARVSLEMSIGLVFCSFSPLVTIFTFIDMALCRLVYGYLLVYAETRKPDLGGYFWVSQLNFLFLALLLHAGMMTGVLWEWCASCHSWADRNGPGILSLASLLVVVYSWREFHYRFDWATLTLQDVTSSDMCKDKRLAMTQNYEQSGGPANETLHCVQRAKASL